MGETVVLVIGYGNSLRNDDGVGPYLAEQIALENLPFVKTLSVHQLTPELAEAIAQVERVIFIDANSDPHCAEIKIQRLDADGQQTGLDHTGSPSYLLAFAKGLYGRMPEAWLVMIPGLDFEFGETFSSVTIQAIPPALEHIRSLIST